MTTPLRAVSLDTGRTQVDLAGWREFYPVDDHDAYVLMHPDTGRTTVQPLGRLPGIVQQCEPAPGFLACQVGDHLEVWGYRG